MGVGSWEMRLRPRALVMAEWGTLILPRFSVWPISTGRCLIMVSPNLGFPEIVLLLTWGVADWYARVVFYGDQDRCFTRQLALETPQSKSWRIGRRLNQVWGVGSWTWKCWKSGLPQYLS